MRDGHMATHETRALLCGASTVLVAVTARSVHVGDTTTAHLLYKAMHWPMLSVHRLSVPFKQRLVPWL